MSSPNRLLRDDSGFTLLETVIAMAIMLLSLTAILSVESGSIQATERARKMNVVAMLAKNKIVETESTIEGKSFDEVKKEDAGQFPSPYQDYRWTAVVKEIKFPNVAVGAQAQQGGGGGANASQGTDQMTDMLSKLVSQFLSKAIREVTVTVIWSRNNKDQSFAVSTYWVDLNHEFDLSQ